MNWLIKLLDKIKRGHLTHTGNILSAIGTLLLVAGIGDASDLAGLEGQITVILDGIIATIGAVGVIVGKIAGWWGRKRIVKAEYR